MESLTELQAKLVRAEAEIEKGVGSLIAERALIAEQAAEGKNVATSRDLLVILEDTHLLNTQHRDRLRRELDGATAKKNRRLNA